MLSSAKTAAFPVAIHRYFEVALYLLVLTGFATLASTGALDLPAVIFVSAALLLRGYYLVQHRTVLIPEKWTTVLTIAYVACYLADYFVISRAFLGSTVHLVLFVMVVRLFSSRRDRDFYFLAVISFLMVLAASVLTVNTSFLLAFVAFMLVGVVAFILMEMRSASAGATVQPRPPGNGSLPRQMGHSLLAVAPAFVFFISLAGAAIFFCLPRLSSGYLNTYSLNGEIATGFSNRVQLGQIGEIQQSSSLVMHIQIDDDTRGVYDLKWRGVTLSLFDGTSWSNPHEQHYIPQSFGGRFILTSPEQPPAGRTIHYRVLMEPIASNVFFLAPTPTSLEGNYRVVAMDTAGAVYDADLERPVSRYEATSAISRPGPVELRSASQDYPPEILLNYLQLPRLDPRIPQLAEQVTASASNDFDRADAIERYLRTAFGYTLQLPRVSHRDPLANFLFERKQGHCEYFASAMAVMLRTQHIPSRVVNGFRTGEFNDVTGQYLVRASNAHSWVEAYFPGYGWISFDPTPPAPGNIRTGWSRALLYVDALASFWREWVISYDVSHQRILGGQVRRSGLEWVRRLQIWGQHEYNTLLDAARRTQRAISGDPLRWSTTVVVIAVLLVLAANTRRLWNALRRRRLAAHPEKAPRDSATIWYQRALRTLAKRGLRRTPAQTPAEFVRTVPGEGIRDSVARFTDHYERARFGNSSQDAARLPELYQEIETAVRK